MTLLIHAMASFMMAGVIWTVQLVHYPLFRVVGRDHWHSYHGRHVARIGPLVGPLMTLELLTAALLAFETPDSLPAWAVQANLALVVLLWIVTGFVQMPQHRRLARRFDRKAIRRLVAGNWTRTAAWSLHAALVLWFLSL